MGRTLNTRLSQAVRGKITVRIRHLAAEHGIAVVTVPARGTSKCCPRCLAPLRHCKAPGRPSDPGWKWARCPGPECGWQGDRDQVAWMRIASRGLARQHKTAIDRAAATMAVRSAGHTLEPAAVITPRAPGRDRSKAGPARRRAARPAPRRRGAPSPVRPPAGLASVRRDTPQRPGRCQGQHAGTRARARPAPPSTAPTGHAERHSAQDSTSTPTPPRHDGKRSPNPQGSLRIT
jgi:Putative transposase DNA-binding domain